jgi:hypothetical protein
VEPWHYPKPVSSFVYRNDSKNGLVKFTDVTSQVAPGLQNIGLVCDAVWTDFDNDNWPDLVLAGEWMSVQFFRNDKGVLKNITATTGVQQQQGWWTSIAPGDFDNDGDIDYILGNVGQNTFYRVSDQYPAKMYAKDFDKNGVYDAVPTLFLQDEDGKRKEFAAHTRDDLIKQINAMRLRFPYYRAFAHATVDSMFSKEDLKDALILQANTTQSVMLKNNGKGKFEMIPLPVQAQLSTVDGMVVDDFDGDGNLDVLLNTNDFGTDVFVGRYDALNGLLLKGNGNGNFHPLSMAESGVWIPGNGKALVKLVGTGKKPLLVAAQNRGALKVFTPANRFQLVPVMPADASALLKLKNGRVQKQEFYFGASFLSQSARYLQVSESVAAVEITDTKGNRRTVAIQ